MNKQDLNVMYAQIAPAYIQFLVDERDKIAREMARLLTADEGTNRADSGGIRGRVRLKKRRQTAAVAAAEDDEESVLADTEDDDWNI